MVQKRRKNTPKRVGKAQEMDIQKVAKKHGFTVLRNLYIGYKSAGKQKYVEIDVVLLSRKGIICVESKNYNCLFTGDLQDQYLRSVYFSGESYSVYNPYLQNKSHINLLQNYLEFNDIKSLIVFSDNTEFQLKSLETIDGDLIKFSELPELLERFNELPDVFTEAKKESLFKKLDKRVKVSARVKNSHKRQVRRNKRKTKE